MKILLDAHVFLWSKNNDPRLSASAWSMLRDLGNELFLSAASVAEISIKSSIRKLKLSQPLEIFIRRGGM